MLDDEPDILSSPVSLDVLPGAHAAKHTLSLSNAKVTPSFPTLNAAHWSSKAEIDFLH